MKILLLFTVLLIFIIILDYFKVSKILRLAVLIDLAMAIMIVCVDKQVPAMYYLLFVLSLFIYTYCISSVVLRTPLIKGRIYRFVLILALIFLCIGAMQIFEDRFCPVNYEYGINASRLVQVVGPALLLLFIVDEFKTFINND